MAEKMQNKKKLLRPGQRASEAEFYEEIGARGGRAGIGRVMQEGAKLPHTQHLSEGYVRLIPESIECNITCK